MNMNIKHNNNNFFSFKLNIKYFFKYNIRIFCSKNVKKSNIQWRGYISSIVTPKPLKIYKSSLNPWLLTGFTDGEGCFTLSLVKNKGYSTGWQVQLTFNITLHQKDLAFLEQIKSFFGVGSITKHGKNTFQYRVSSRNDLKVILNHFDKYPLITQKWADYFLFKMIINLINNKEHLTIEGLRKGI